MTQATAAKPSERRTDTLYDLYAVGLSPLWVVIKSRLSERWISARCDDIGTDVMFDTFTEAIAYADRVARE